MLRREPTGPHVVGPPSLRRASPKDLGRHARFSPFDGRAAPWVRHLMMEFL